MPNTPIRSALGAIEFPKEKNPIHVRVQTMTELIEVRTQLWVRVLIVVGLPLLAWAGVYTLWITIAAGFHPLFMSIVQFGAGVFCVVAVFKGIPLLRFFRHKLILHSEGIEIASGKISSYFTWAQIGSIRASDTFNILSVYDQAGSLIYAVDYYAENFRHLAGQLSALSTSHP